MIKELHAPEAGGQTMVVNWYYRPNEVVGGRKVRAPWLSGGIMRKL